MKTKNSFVIIVILILGGLLSSGNIVSQGIQDQITGKAFLKNPKKPVLQFSFSGVQDFKHFDFHKKQSIDVDTPHPDSIISYCMSSLSMKEIYTYDNHENTIAYRRQYLNPGAWVNAYQILNSFDGNGNVLTSLLQNWQNNIWVDSSRITNTYDGNGNMLTNLLENRVSGNWVNASLGNFTYDGSGNNLTETDQVWDGSGWVNSTLITNTYNGTGKKLTSQTQQWDGTSWTNSMLETWTYDGTGNNLTAMVQQWDGSNWLYSSLETWTYDASGNNLSYLSQSSWDGITWVNNWTIIYTYDSNGNQLTELDQMWQDPDWQNYALSTYTYDNNGNRLTYLYQNWYGSWTNYSRGTSTYDGNGNCLTEIHQLWNANTWRNYVKSEYTYQNNMINGDGFGWNGGDWVPGESSLSLRLPNNGNPLIFFQNMAYNAKAYWSLYPTGTKDFNTLPSSLLMIYPNPANNYLTLKPNLNQPEQVCFNLINFSGTIVSSYNEGIIQPDSQTFTIYTGNLPAGEYILEMKAGNIREKQKVTIMK